MNPYTILRISRAKPASHQTDYGASEGELDVLTPAANRSCVIDAPRVGTEERVVNRGFVCKHCLFAARNWPRSRKSRGRRKLPAKGDASRRSGSVSGKNRKILKTDGRREGQETGRGPRRGPPADVRTDGWREGGKEERRDGWTDRHRCLILLLLLLLHLFLLLVSNRTQRRRKSRSGEERSAYLGSGRMIFLLARAAGVHLLFSMAIR